MLGSLPCAVDGDNILDPFYYGRRHINRLSLNLSNRLRAVWSKWVVDYLNSLRGSHMNERNGCTRVSVGGVVLLMMMLRLDYNDIWGDCGGVQGY